MPYQTAPTRRDWFGRPHHGQMDTTADCITFKHEGMEKMSISIDDLNVAIASAVNAAMEARDEKRKTTLVSRKATALRLQVNPSTLWRWARVGFLRPVRIAGRLWYPEDAIEKIERGEINV